jgi:hypothetical protein
VQLKTKQNVFDGDIVMMCAGCRSVNNGQFKYIKEAKPDNGKEKPAKKKSASKPSRSYSMKDIYNWKFEEHELPEEWAKHLGELPQRFHIYVDGDAKNGKSEYVIKLAKMLAIHFGKVRLNNLEEGKHKHIQQSIMRNDFKNTVPKGRFAYDVIRDFETYKKRIARTNSGRVQIIDSISFWKLTEEQIQYLIQTFKNKCFIFVAYKAHATRNKPIIHLTDIEVNVKDFVAHATGRFGGQKPFVIWDRPKASVQPSLFGNVQPITEN